MIFLLFLSDKLGPENVFDDILQRENAFLDHKNELKKSESWHFS